MNKPARPTFASIDIGSHTIRLLIAEEDGGKGIVPLRLERRITRLARDFQAGGTLKDASIRKSIEVMVEYAGLLKEYGVSAVSCGATGVIRRAVNGEAFLGAVADATGVRGRIVSETAEAFLSAKGVLSVIPSATGTIVTFDLGGSSTEFLLVETGRTEPTWSTSVFLGAATVTERHLRGDPVEATSLLSAGRAIRETLAPALSELNSLLGPARSVDRSFQMVGTAGTATTLAAMYLKMTDYDPFKVNGVMLTREWLTTLIEALARLPLASRREIPGLEPGREDIILGGALIVREVLAGLDEERLTIADGGFLEGLLLDLLERQHGWHHTLKTCLTWRPVNK